MCNLENSFRRSACLPSSASPREGLDPLGRSYRKKDLGSIKEDLPDRTASNTVPDTKQGLDACLG